MMRSAWREHMDVHLRDLRARLNEHGVIHADDPRACFVTAADTALTEAKNAVDEKPTAWSAWSGIHVERAWSNAHLAEVALLRLTPSNALPTALTKVLARSEFLLLRGDERIKRLQERLAAAPSELTENDRELAADAMTGAFAASEAEHVRVRSFRNLLLASTLAVAVIAIVLGICAALSPGSFALCGTAAKGKPLQCPTGGSHPSGGDLLTVELLGLIAAAVTAAVAIRNLRGTSTPYAVPLASQLLKLPVGALTAVGGLLLARGGAIPALDKLTAEQVRAYALVFGAAQQVFMQLVDRQAQTVLNSVKSPDRDSAKPRRRRGT